MKCLICDDAITHARMGINACRACAAFYKRTNAKFGRLRCKEGTNKCRETNPKASCRKCRLVRFRAVMARARREESSTTSDEKSLDDDVSPQERSSTSFVDHTSFFDCEPSTSETPLLNKIRKGYSILCMIRKSAELAAKPQCKCEGEMRIDDLVFTPATYNSIFPFTRIAKEAIIDFANHSFDEYRALDDSDKRFIMEASYPLMQCLECTYRVCHYFPKDKEIGLPGYTTYMHNNEMEGFLADCTDNIDRANVIREIRKTHESRMKNVREHFETYKLTDVEFLALFSLAFWNERVVEDKEKLQQLANSIRSEIMNELHCYYSSQGMTEYATRVGNIFCLLVNSQKESDKTVEDFQILRCYKMFESIFIE